MLIDIVFLVGVMCLVEFGITASIVVTQKLLDQHQIQKMANQLQAALRARDPYGVGVALELPHIAPSKSGEKLRPHHATLRDSGHDWSQVASSLLDAKAAARAGDANKCYEAQSALHSSLNHLFASYSGNWLIPALHVACKHTHFVAVACSTQKDQSQMQNAVNLLQESFSRCLNDRTEYQVRLVRVWQLVQPDCRPSHLSAWLYPSPMLPCQTRDQRRLVYSIL